VLDVDPTSLAFGPLSATPFRDQDVQLRDIDRDGFEDLIAVYRFGETGIGEEDSEGCLVAETYAGLLLEGCAPLAGTGTLE
jgi:hypothetical protein